MEQYKYMNFKMTKKHLFKLKMSITLSKHFTEIYGSDNMKTPPQNCRKTVHCASLSHPLLFLCLLITNLV